MLKFTEVCDARGEVTSIQTSHQGQFLLGVPELNKGSAFTEAEREEFQLKGKLPAHVESIEEQAARYYAQCQALSTDLAKNDFLNNLKRHNMTVFYYLVSQHLAEFMPIIYTPTIGKAVENYSFQFNAPCGLYMSYTDRGSLHLVTDNISFPQVDLIIVTDGEGVLGIGDWGVGGIDICVGKLMVYTLCGGINPRRVLPIQIDVGTNNQTLLDDPMYLGWRHRRIEGAAYDAFIDEVVQTLQEKFPGVYLHWEDFGRDNARKNLNRYRDSMCTFNDDMQGTGATATACVLSGLRSIDESIVDQRIVIFGAGTAGVGIADQLVKAMVHEGVAEAAACRCIWLVDRPGVLTDAMDDLLFFQQPYARPAAELADWSVGELDKYTLLDVVREVKPTILIGCSTVRNAFNEDVVRTMLQTAKRPIIFPLSNPTSCVEAKPQDLFDWTDGKAIVATGSPFEPVQHDGKAIRISQCNNAFVFPGLGLGVIAVKATRVTDGMVAAACVALSEVSPVLLDRFAPVLPDITEAPRVSRHIAVAVAKQAIAEGVASLAITDVEDRVSALFWQPRYFPYERVD